MEVCSTTALCTVVLRLVTFWCSKCSGACFRVVLALLVLCALLAPAGAQQPPTPQFVANRVLVDQREALDAMLDAEDARELRLTCSVAFLQPQHDQYLRPPFKIQFRRQSASFHFEMLTVRLWAQVHGALLRSQRQSLVPTLISIRNGRLLATIRISHYADVVKVSVHHRRLGTEFLKTTRQSLSRRQSTCNLLTGPHGSAETIPLQTSPASSTFHEFSSMRVASINAASSPIQTTNLQIPTRQISLSLACAFSHKKFLH